ncbi:MAG: ATP-binding protein [Verrucomicrobiota bacterium]
MPPNACYFEEMRPHQTTLVIRTLVFGLGALVCTSSAHGFFFEERKKLKDKISDVKAEMSALPKLPPQTLPWTLGFYHHHDQKSTEPFELTIEFPAASPVDTVALIPALRFTRNRQQSSFGFPRRFKLDLYGIDGTVTTVADFADQNYPLTGVYVQEPHMFFVDSDQVFAGIRITVHEFTPGQYENRPETFALSEVFAFNGEHNVALNSQVSHNEAHTYRSGYVWTPAALVDGFMLHYPIDPSGRFDSEFFSKRERIRLLFDFESKQPIDEVRIWPDLAKPNHNFPNAYGVGFPQDIRLEVVDDPDDDEPRTIFASDPERNMRPGANPYSIRIVPTASRYFVLDLGNALEEFRTFNPSRSIRLSEIQFLKQGKVVSGGLAPKVGVLQGSQVETASNFLDQINGITKIRSLTDGRTSEGSILPLKQWLIDQAKRAKLQRRLTNLQKQLPAMMATEKQNIRWATILSVAVTVILILIICVVILFARQNLYKIKQRLASDLHDEIGANINSVGQHIELALELKESNADGADQILRDALDVNQLTSEETRNLNEFLGDRRNDFSFLSRVRRTAKIILRNTKCTFEFNEMDWFDQQPVLRKWDLMLFIKEALTNVAKHADASEVTIGTCRESGKVIVQIADNGRGIPDEQIPPDQLHKRSLALKGHLDIKTSENNGTAISLGLKST